MELTKEDCGKYAQILREELMTALGCTEPISIAYAAARARQVLGRTPERMTVHCSGNLIKNAKAVVVPMTVDLRGIEAAALAGAVGGDPDRELEVLSSVTKEDLQKVRELLAQHVCKVKLLDTRAKLHLIVQCESGSDSATVEIMHTHNQVVHVEKNGETIFEIPHEEDEISTGGTDRSCLSLEKIVEYARTADYSDVRDLLQKQAACNFAISQEGLKGKWGENVGKTLHEVYGNGIRVRAVASAAAGSDARMNGCEMPVVINSGSGNQGITVSVPVIEYAKELGKSEDETYRAMLVSNLVAIELKYKVGRLSAFCGAVSAGTAAVCGIAFLQGADAELIGMIITNSLGAVGGIVCDGAKSSCAAKISAALESGLLSYEMAKKGRVFRSGEGLVGNTYEQTIDNYCRMAKDGMRETDDEILHIMLGE